MNILKIIIALILSYQIQIFFIYSQEYNPEELEQLLERIAEETGIAPELDAIEEMITNPLNLCSASISELTKVPGFTHKLSKSILSLVKANEKIEYSQITDSLMLSYEQSYLLQLCTVIEPLEKTYIIRPKKAFYLRARIENQFEEREGFRKNAYLGSPIDYYQRATLYLKDFSANVTTTKDIGESKLIDFISYNINGNIFDTKFTLGDFYVESGLGSILWKSFGLRKGSDAISPVIQEGEGIVAYRSSLENDFFRGLGVERNWKIGRKNKLMTSVWFSSTLRTAHIDTSLNAATSLRQDGYYRTTSELDEKANLNEKSIGGIVEWRSNNLLLGASAIGLEYDKPIYSKSKSAFLGTSGIISSLYGNISLDNVTISSELSRDALGNLGIKAALQYEETRWAIAALYRSFAGDFRSPFGYNFGESSIPSNETGLYFGVNLKFIENINISAYFDIYKNYTRTYDISMPGKGNEFFTEIEWKIAPKTLYRARIRYENKTLQSKDEQTSKYLTFQSSRYLFRSEVEYSITSKLRFRGRVEYVLIAPEEINPSENGVVGFCEVIWQPIKEIRTGSRITYFSTDSYNSAIWQYEAVMPGIMMSPALYGNGSRVYIFAKFTPFSFIDIWAKYSFMSKNDVKSLGSGLDEIFGNNENRLLLQIETKF